MTLDAGTGGGPPAARDAAGVGRVVGGRYRLEAWLGAGGMGRVWRAHDEVLRVDVALKEIRFPADLEAAERAGQVDAAMREARAAAQLRGNPHVVTVHDAVEHDGLPWLVMEYVPADTLATVVDRSGPLPVSQVADIGLAVLDALVAGARLGVLHRDVKPSNVLLAHDGRVLLTDFGIAAHASDPTLPDRSAGAARPGPVVRAGGDGQILPADRGLLVVAALERLRSGGGTPAYTAPERLINGTATLASDLFSLGASLYLAVEGHSPFAREDLAATVRAVMEDDPAEFTRAGPVAHAIAGLLAKSPATRLGADGAGTLLRWARQPALSRAPAVLTPTTTDRGADLSGAEAARADRAEDAPAASGASATPPLPSSDRRRSSLDPGAPVPLGRLPGQARFGAPGRSSGRNPAAGGPRRPSLGRTLPIGGWLPAGISAVMVMVAVVAALVAGAVYLLAASGSNADAHGRDPSGFPTSAPPSPLIATVPAAMIGRWQGTVAQGALSFPLTMTLRAGQVGETVGTARNPRDGCTSDLRLVSAGADDDPSSHEVPATDDGQGATSARFHEQLTGGAPSCTAVDVDVVTVRSDGDLDLSYSASLLTSSGHGVLRRAAP
ncbi:eukaryotic-like serine/threonine-protein kinase [Frankia sp. AiPs1]|uniref:serine/threonine-protein kinase n=1 Tax=Frankia sp. AiPa1 TaxID=573492 RepID=UPI00202B19BA|nr:serine/threonine-protein kinase [Frankia sp. AiPa1]MCL9761336.1 serine/threonine protein kinase [Frankia sp. AiPa1]